MKTRKSMYDYREHWSLTLFGYLAMYTINALILLTLVTVIGLGSHLLLWAAGLGG